MIEDRGDEVIKMIKRMEFDYEMGQAYIRTKAGIGSLKRIIKRTALRVSDLTDSVLKFFAQTQTIYRSIQALPVKYVLRFRCPFLTNLISSIKYVIV